jgi:hypothetical protein
MTTVLRIAAGVAAGVGLIALAGANLHRIDEPAEARPSPAAAVVGPAPAGPARPGADVEPAAWRSAARPPEEPPPGMLARMAAARRNPGKPPVCGEAPAAPGQRHPGSSSGAGSAAAVCAPPPAAPNEPIEIDWNAQPSGK